ncbi:MAG: phosphomethylpyrimidine synthase ThiC, partial [Thermodesulfovibrionales bacterium]|nr:phosphomethylpyrimidine synthase ThiC [Thermodesulfovibrionales bacterium]
MTRIETARNGAVSEEVRQCAAGEGIDPERLSQHLAEGLAVITRNNRREIPPLGIGRDLSTKVNANIGTSKDRISIDEEKAKLAMLVRLGCDAVMELSTGGPIRDLREYIIKNTTIPLGTVPIYEGAIKAAEAHGNITKMTPDDMFGAIEAHGEQGVDFVTVHSGLTLRAIERLKSQGRTMDIVSRGGSFLLEWMVINEKENPLFEDYDRLLEIAKKYDMTLSLGDALRPGCLTDATDRAQIEELLTLGELRDRALEQGVQVIIE